jgi:hypothetical protein
MGRNLMAQCVINQRVLIQALERYMKDPLRPKEYWTILHEAAAFGQDTMLKYALMVERSQPGPGAITPLQVAVTNGWAELVPMLIEKGADPHLQNDQGTSPFEMACMQRWPTDLLMKAFGSTTGATCNIPLEKPNRPFNYAGPGGGWFKSEGEQLRSMCEVDVRESITPHAFVQEYVITLHDHVVPACHQHGHQQCFGRPLFVLSRGWWSGSTMGFHSSRLEIKPTTV